MRRPKPGAMPGASRELVYLITHERAADCTSCGRSGI
jgi:hypothetical protein